MEKNGIVQSIIFRNASNGYTVLALVSDGAALPLTCVGVMPLLNEGDQVQMEGEMAHHIRFGDQFVVRAYQRQAPSTIGAIIAYLSGGTVKGVGPSMARIIVSHFGMDTLRIMENEPTRLTEVPGIGMKKMRMIADSFLSQKQLRDILLEQAALAAAETVFRQLRPLEDDAGGTLDLEQVIREHQHGVRVDGLFGQADQDFCDGLYRAQGTPPFSAWLLTGSAGDVSEAQSAERIASR